MLRKRIRKLGWFKVFGQVFFQLFIVKPLGFLSRKRINELKKNLNLDTTPIPSSKVKLFETINDDECIELIAGLKPDLVLVKGTRILSKKILAAVNAPFINMHVGITPLYRGVHGAYWALANKDGKNAGTTIHYVDPGIDTGSVIAQEYIEVTEKDNFITYPLVQIAAGIALLKKYLPAILRGEKILQEKLPEGRSRLWSHPTIWFYIRKRLFNGIK
jgi:methionyl-tRNA formyltransferase